MEFFWWKGEKENIQNFKSLEWVNYIFYPFVNFLKYFHTVFLKLFSKQFYLLIFFVDFCSFCSLSILYKIWVFFYLCKFCKLKKKLSGIKFWMSLEKMKVRHDVIVVKVGLMIVFIFNIFSIYLIYINSKNIYQ